MPTAVKIEKLDSSWNPVVALNFEEYEIYGVTVNPVQPSKVVRNQKNKPTLFRMGNPWHVVGVNFRIHGEETTGKLGTIRNAAKNGEYFRVYPAMTDDNTISYDCLIPPESLVNSYIAGRHRGGERVTLTFMENNV